MWTLYKNLILAIQSSMDRNTASNIIVDERAERVTEIFIEYVREGRIGIIVELLKYDIDSHTKNLALLEAVAHNRVELVTLLLQNGADVHTEEDSALILSVEHSRLPIVIQLLEWGADASAALIVSAENNDLQILSKLLEYGNATPQLCDHLLRLVIYKRSCSMKMRRKWCDDDCNLQMVAQLLNLGANLRSDVEFFWIAHGSILERLRDCPNKKVAHAILPFCHSSDHVYFLDDHLYEYFKNSGALTKNANKR